MAVVTNLYRYPIKGLSAQPVDTVALKAGKPFPFDRVFALARPGISVTAENPKWAKKGFFVMLMLDEALASVRTHIDERTLQLTVLDGQRPVLSAGLDDLAGQAQVETFFQKLVPSLRTPPTLVRSRGGHFMDKPDDVISLLNLATVRALEEQWGYAIDPLRFRANIVIDGAAPWEEFDWVGEQVRIGDAVFVVDRRNGRCSATNVDPATGRRDLDIPGALRRQFGHKDLGVYLVAQNGATLRVGDRLERVASFQQRPPSTSALPSMTSKRAFICRGCYLVFDETVGLPAAGVAAGTRFAELPAAWRCPDCGTEKTSFSPHGQV